MKEKTNTTLNTESNTSKKSGNKAKTKTLRGIAATVVFVALSLGLLLNIQMGTLSGFGWDTISALCPLGAFTTMIATKTFVPRALISIIVMGILVLVVGRAFCGWICPVNVLDRVRNFFRSPKKRRELEAAKHEECLAISRAEMGLSQKESGDGAVDDGASALAHDCSACGLCKQKRTKLDSRHYVLGGALLSTAIFGFPVFCLVCPVGLTFATVLVFWRLFMMGDMTWSVVLIPLLLFVEIILLRKWCTRFCPLAGLMNLLSRFAKPFRPVIDDSKCLETSKGAPCSKCAMACEHDINLRHPDFGERTLDDCTRCRACVEACPAHAISMPFMVKKDASGNARYVIDEKVKG